MNVWLWMTLRISSNWTVLTSLLKRPNNILIIAGKYTCSWWCLHKSSMGFTTELIIQTKPPFKWSKAFPWHTTIILFGGWVFISPTLSLIVDRLSCLAEWLLAVVGYGHGIKYEDDDDRQSWAPRTDLTMEPLRYRPVRVVWAVAGNTCAPDKNTKSVD